MDIYSFLRANGPLLAVIGILASIMAIIIVGSRYLRASPSSRKGIITAMAMPFALLSVSTLAACNSGNNPGSIDRRATPTNTVPRVPSEPSSPGGHQQPIANAIYASPGDDLQKKARSLSAGQTLILRDGTYSKLMVEGMHGSQASPITIHAEHDGQAITDGGFSDPAINVNHSSYVVVEGLVARNGGPNVVSVTGDSDHVIIRRVTAHDTAPGNNHVFSIKDGPTNVLVEDCAGWGRGRYIFIAYHAMNVTFRRDWAHWEHQENFSEAPRAGYSVYGSSNVTFENVMGMGAYPRPGINDDNSYNAVYETSDGPPVDNVKYIGDIFYNNMDGIYFNEASGKNSQVINSYIETPNTMPGPAGSTTNEKGTGFTWWNHYSGSITNSTFTNTPVAASLQNGSASLTNTVFYNNGKAIDGDLRHSYADFWQNRSIGTNLVSTDKVVDPGFDTKTYGRGAYLFIPPNSPLKQAGQNGQDIGATILYASVDGQLTNTPLWPWPMEDRIKAETGMSVTWESGGGIWKTLDGVYPKAALSAPSPSSLLANPLFSPLFSIIREGYFTMKRVKK